MFSYLEKISKFLNQLLLVIGGITLVAMMLLTCSNIFSRLVWVPIKGVFELMGYFGAIAAAFALGSTQMKRGHIAVDVLTRIFPQKTKVILNGFNALISMGFFAFASWEMARWATTIWETGEVTETLRIIYFPFIYGVAVGCGALALVLLIDFLKSLKDA